MSERPEFTAEQRRIVEDVVRYPSELDQEDVENIERALALIDWQAKRIEELEGKQDTLLRIEAFMPEMPNVEFLAFYSVVLQEAERRWCGSAKTVHMAQR